MGMFDYVLHEGVEYQSKDTPDQAMSRYRIVNGRLIGDEWHYEDTPEDQLPYAEKLKDPNITDKERALFRWCGSITRVIDRADVDQNWHGYIYLIGAGPDYPEYRAKFTDGNLVAFERLSPGTGASR